MTEASLKKALPTPEMNQRMMVVLKEPGNQVCAECPAKRPLWGSFLAISSNSDKSLGVLCCSSCAIHHHFELGEKRCMIKYLKMAHEWTIEDIEKLEISGNAKINEIFEAKLTKEDFDKQLVLEEEEEEDTRRSKFIKHKYKKQKYIDQIQFHEQMLGILKARQSKNQTTEEIPVEISVTSSQCSLTSADDSEEMDQSIGDSSMNASLTRSSTGLNGIRNRLASSLLVKNTEQIEASTRRSRRSIFASNEQVKREGLLRRWASNPALFGRKTQSSDSGNSALSRRQSRRNVSGNMKKENEGKRQDMQRVASDRSVTSSSTRRTDSMDASDRSMTSSSTRRTSTSMSASDRSNMISSSRRTGMISSRRTSMMKDASDRSNKCPTTRGGADRSNMSPKRRGTALRKASSERNIRRADSERNKRPVVSSHDSEASISPNNSKPLRKRTSKKSKTLEDTTARSQPKSSKGKAADESSACPASPNTSLVSANRMTLAKKKIQLRDSSLSPPSRTAGSPSKKRGSSLEAILEGATPWWRQMDGETEAVVDEALKAELEADLLSIAPALVLDGQPIP